MEILFQEKTTPAYRDAARLTKQTVVSMESVVPDTKDDIGRILSVRPVLFLKSRERRGQSAEIDAETLVSVLYINEAGTAVSSFRTTQALRFEFELPPEAGDGGILQVSLDLVGVSSRIINSRKAGVDLEISCGVCVSVADEVTESQSLPEDCPAAIHVLEETHGAELLTNVCEKAVSFSEQFDLSEKGAAPSEILCMEKQLTIGEKQVIGGRLLLKGDIALRIDVLTEGRAEPARMALSMPFSQLIDLENEDAENISVKTLWTQENCELIETLDGLKLLNVDLRALLQVRGSQNKTIRFASDAYSNSMPCECVREALSLPLSADESAVRLTGEDRIELPENYRELVTAYLTPGRCSAAQGTVTAELLCAGTDDRLSVIRRMIPLIAPDSTEDQELTSCRISDFTASAEGDHLMLRVAAEGIAGKSKTQTVERLRSLSLDESAAFDSAAWPSLTAVWAETESVWELAKLYRSSPEAIEAFNSDLSVNPVLIPKAP